MKFKMIAGCLAAGLGLVSVGAHAAGESGHEHEHDNDMQCQPKEKVLVRQWEEPGGPTRRYQIKQYTVRYRLKTPGCDRIPSDASRFEITLEFGEKAQVEKVPLDRPYRDVYSGPIEQLSLVAEVLKEEERNGVYKRTYYNKFKTTQESPNGPILQGPLPKVLQSEGLRVVITAPKPFICDLPFPENSHNIAWVQANEIKKHSWRIFGVTKYCINPIDPKIKFIE